LDALRPEKDIEANYKDIGAVGRDVEANMG
jgi:hypothetical protein